MQNLCNYLTENSFSFATAEKQPYLCTRFLKQTSQTVQQAFFFDMDGTLFDSMPNHAKAWEITAAKYGLYFPQLTCYQQEGRTGYDILCQLFHEQRKNNTKNANFSEADAALIHQIYLEKSQLFHEMGEPEPIPGAQQLLQYLHQLPDTQLWIVTGSAQQSLFDRLNLAFPGIFTRQRMITALDIQRGKPAPEPYLAAWHKSQLPKQQCFVIENAPLGVRSAKAAGLCTYAVNTGPLPDQDLRQEGADHVFSNMKQLLSFLQHN